jgi:hypothetical protein
MADMMTRRELIVPGSSTQCLPRGSGSPVSGHKRGSGFQWFTYCDKFRFDPTDPAWR